MSTRPWRPVSATASRSGDSMPISREVKTRMRSSSETILSRVNERTRAISTSSGIGLVKKSSAPASSPRTLSEGWSSAVTMTTGIWWVAGLVFNRRHTSNPSMSGIITSSRTRSHSARSQIVSASSPLMAVITSKYSADSRASSSLTLARTSSTTRMRAVIASPSRIAQEVADGLDELTHRNRFGQVSLAATLADALLVAFHGKSGDGHHRNALELFIVLEPLRHFKTRHFRKLDIHQNQIRPVLARQVERFNAVACSDCLVAVRLQKVVEELHVELVVFHDQDSLCHPQSFAAPGDAHRC